MSPGTCSCRRGYVGASCEQDLDECAAGRHRCPASAAHCVNMPGWYYCRCRPGFRTAFKDAEEGAVCMGERAWSSARSKAMSLRVAHRMWPGLCCAQKNENPEFGLTHPRN